MHLNATNIREKKPGPSRFPLASILAVLLLAMPPPFVFGAAPLPARGASGMVVTSEPMAAAIGLQVLEDGGNAIDAAVAVGFALAVTYPYGGNLGGGGFMLVHLAKSHETVVIDFREVAPAAATRDMYLNAQGKADTFRSTIGHLAVGVPGTVAGLTLARDRYGSRKLSKLLEPSIRLAEKGYKVSWFMARDLEKAERDFRRFPATSAIFLRRDGSSLREGDLLVQKDLANTLRLIAKKGADGFYRGETARLIALDMKMNGGILTAEDLERYTPIVRKPLTGHYRGYDVLTMPPPSSGGVHLLQMLNLLEPFPLAYLGHNSAQSIHLMAEAMKRAYADRSFYLGDPAFCDIPMEGLLSKGYADHLRASFDRYRATPSSEIIPGDPTQRGAPKSGYVTPAYLKARENAAAPRERPNSQTTHVSVTDRFGNAVSLTYTINLPFGSRAIAAGTGVLLNDEMDDFSLKPGIPNAYGLIGGEANAIEAGKRPLSSMTPTIVLEDGKVALVTGSPGGSRIITSVLQVLLNVIDHQMDVSEAVSAPRVHHQWRPDRLRIEPQIGQDTRALLGKKGYTLEVRKPWGGCNSIARDPETGGWLGAYDPRKDGAARGY